MGVSNLHLHIDRIVVEGLPESGQRRFRRALEAQLQELAESGIADGFEGNLRKHIKALNTGQLRSGATPEQAAAQVARSIRQSVFENQPAFSTARPSKAAHSTAKISGGEARHDV